MARNGTMRSKSPLHNVNINITPNYTKIQQVNTIAS